MENSPIERPIIWTIGGGKGGIGKSLITCNLGICLSKSGQKVLLVDADFGAANLHTLLRADGAPYPFSSFIKGKIFDIQNIIAKTPIHNLDLISGAKDSLNIADFHGNNLSRFHDALKKIEYHYILIDTGPGTSSNMLDLFLTADEGILIVLPEPTSIENTLRFLKCLFIYKMKKILDSQEEGKLKYILKNIFYRTEGPKVKTIADVFFQLKKLGNNGKILKSIMENVGISIAVNQTKKPEDADIGLSLKRAWLDYFGFEIGYLGHICYDDFVGDSIRYMKPLNIHYNQSLAAKAIEGITEKLLKKKKNISQKFDFDEIQLQ